MIEIWMFLIIIAVCVGIVCVLISRPSKAENELIERIDNIAKQEQELKQMLIDGIKNIK